MPQLSDFLTNGNSNTGLPTAFTNLTTGEAVQQGDIICQGADGLGYWAADPTLVGSSLRPIASAVAQLNSLAGPALSVAGVLNAGSSTVQQLTDSALLSNGSVVVVGYNSTNSFPQFSIFSSTGGLVAGPVAIDTVASSGCISVSPISAGNGGGFVVAWIPTTGTTSAKYASFSNTGVAAITATTVEVANPSYCVVKVAALAGGGFAIAAHTNVASNGVRCSRYNAAGVLQGSVLVVDSVTSTGSQHSDSLWIVGLTGGGFVVAYSWSSSTYQAYFVQYNAAGAVVTVKTLIPNSNSVSLNLVAAVATTDGGFVVGSSQSGGSTTASPPRATKYSSVGALVGGIVVGGSFATNGSGMRLAALTGGGCAIVLQQNTTGLQYSIMNTSGVQVGSTLNPDAAMTTSGVVNITALSDGGILIVASGTIVATVEFFRYDSTFFTKVGATNLITPSGTAWQVACFPLVNPLVPAANTYGVFWANGTSGFAVYNAAVPKMTPVGVATAAAAASASVRIQSLGPVQTRLTFNQAYTVNARNNPTPGQRMSIVGNLAVMNGIQSPGVGRNIN